MSRALSVVPGGAGSDLRAVARRVKRRAGRTAQRTSRRVPGGQSALRLLQDRQDRERILRSGLFDADWYSLVSGRDFSTPAKALDHYLSVGRRSGLSPHALIEPEWIESRLWHAEGKDPLLVYLQTKRINNPPSAAFDAREWMRNTSGGRGPNGPLAQALAAGPDTEIPLALSTEQCPPGPSPWVPVSRVQHHLNTVARQWRAMSSLRELPRRSSTYDHAAEQSLLTSLRGRQVSAPADGRPLVSVIMPVHNRAALVAEAIASVQEQTMPHWELVVVDDGSTDGTAEVVARIADRDSRVRVVSGEHAGVSRARNLGIDCASGDYIAFLDSDNQWFRDYLRVMLLTLGEAGIDAAYSAIELHGSDTVAYRAADGGLEHLRIANHIDLNVLVLTREILDRVGHFDTSLRRTVDYDLVLRLAKQTTLHYVPYLGCRYADGTGAGDRITVRESVAWDYVVRARHWLDWPTAQSRSRVSGRTTVIITTRNQAVLTRRCVAAVLRTTAEHDVEIIIVDNHSRRSQLFEVSLCELLDPRIKVIALPVNFGHAVAVDLALAHATGDVVAVCHSAAIPEDGWLDRFRDSLQDREVKLVQAVGVGPDGAIIRAGVTFPDRRATPMPILAGQPVEDLAASGRRVRIRAAHALLYAVRTDEIVAHEGLDPRFLQLWTETDLSLRLTEGGGRCEVRTDVEVSCSPVIDRTDPVVPESARSDQNMLTERWGDLVEGDDDGFLGAAGLAKAHLRSEQVSETYRRLSQVLVRPQRFVSDGPAVGSPALRWAIKTSAPAGPQRTEDPEWQLAQSVAAALRHLGQDVVVDTCSAHHRSSSYLDDVNLVLRGPDPFTPDTARLNLLWVVSHGDTVTAAELSDYQAVFAGGLAAMESLLTLADSHVEFFALPSEADVTAQAELLLETALKLR